ncbi:MAG: DNA-3-methyladenine glycosylase [Solirubrobacterales bacterium]|nr:DNA-3-methyladenine glycosylase [Solirubrobacterales bacterium]
MAHPALEHLAAADPVLARLIAGMDAAALTIVVDPARGGRYPPVPAYGDLVRIILGQQVSVGAARAMVARLTARYDGALPTPEQVLADDPEALRAAGGLSRAKLRFVRGLAEEVVTGRLDLDALADVDDETVLARLCAVTGIGPWTAHVFLMGHLRRPDVLAPGDLGIRRAVGVAYELDASPTPDAVVAMAEAWRPHRSTACRLLWKSLDAVPIGADGP